MVAAPVVTPVQMNHATAQEKGGKVAEDVADALLGMAGVEWQTPTSTLWEEYRKDGIDIEKLGNTSSGEDVYQLERKKTGGPLTLILDVEAL